MKKKIFTISALVLLCVAMIGVGFAGWVISNEPEPVGRDGQFTTETVSNNSYTISEITPDGDFKFSDPESPTVTTYKWLTSDDAVYEDLEVVFTTTIQKGGENLSETLTPQIAEDAHSVSLDNDIDEITVTLEDLISSEYIGDCKITAASYSNGTLSITVKASWGTAFEGQNPYYYYNKQEYTPDLASKATTALKALNEISSKVLFNLKVEVGAYSE